MIVVNAQVDENGKLTRLETDGEEVLFLVSQADGSLSLVESETRVNLDSVYKKLKALLKPKRLK